MNIASILLTMMPHLCMLITHKGSPNLEGIILSFSKLYMHPVLCRKDYKCMHVLHLIFSQNESLNLDHCMAHVSIITFQAFTLLHLTGQYQLLYCSHGVILRVHMCMTNLCRVG